MNKLTKEQCKKFVSDFKQGLDNYVMDSIGYKHDPNKYKGWTKEQFEAELKRIDSEIIKNSELLSNPKL